MSDGPRDPRTAARHALIAFLVVAPLVAVLVRLDVELPAIGHLGSALIAVVFLYVPVIVAYLRKEDIADYAFHAHPVKRGLITAAAAIAVIFPLFTLGYFAFYELLCTTWLADLAPARMCSRFGGLAGLRTPEWSWSLEPIDGALSLGFCLVQLVVVALPEELFFRGFLLGMLEQRFPPKRRILGGGVGVALVLSSLAFAVIHLPKGGDPRVLATFFPGLLFGWMRSATGSILASTVTHAGSNILIKLLQHALHR